MKTRKTHWLRTTVVVLVICGIAGLALTAAMFFGNPDPTYATATIEFSFDGAANGIAPNGASFDLSEIWSDEVLADALKAASLEGTYTPQQLRDSLVVRGVYPEDIAEQATNYESLLDFKTNRATTVGDYHATTYGVVLYNGFDKAISRENLEALMQGIMTSYQAFFASRYAYGLEAQDPLFDLEQYDYPQQLEIMQRYYEEMTGYAQELYEKEAEFRYEGKGFNDINVRLNTLITSDISRLNADLTMNALTRNVARLTTQYQYEIQALSTSLEKKTEQLERMDALIASYEKDEIIYVSTSESLTKIDGNSSETYDELVVQRKEIADSITQINSQISVLQLKLSDLLKNDSAASPVATSASAQSSSEGQSDVAAFAEDVVEMTDEEMAEAVAEAERKSKAQTIALEKNIATVQERGGNIVADFSQMIQAYNAQEINDLTVCVSKYDYETPKLVSGAFVKKAIKTAGPICAIGFMLCMIMIIISRKKEEKRQGSKA